MELNEMREEERKILKVGGKKGGEINQMKDEGKG